MIVISKTLSLAAPPDPNWTTANNPLIGWRNILTPAMVMATSQDALFPVSNVANPITFLKWKSLIATEQYLTINTGEHEPATVDYLAIARHNIGTIQAPIAIEGLIGGSWISICDDVVLPDDRPVIFRFSPLALADIRIHIYPGNAAPEIAVVYLGRLLILQRRIYVGHTPIIYGRKTKKVNGRSESGQYLGSIITTESLATALSMQNITPGWYRENLDPFLANKEPFFFAWRPEEYPREVGYAWLTADANPSNQRGNGMMQVQLSMSGIAE